MFKRILIASAILAACSTTGFAGGFYIGPTLVMQTTTASNSSYRGLSPRMSLGYDEEMASCVHLGGEIFATPATLDISDNTSAGGQSAKTTRSFGAVFIPGIMLNDYVMGYLRLGLIVSKFSGPDSYATGGQFGLGMATMLTDHWGLRGEYSYNSYRSISGLGSPRTDMYALGLTHDFDGF